MAANNINIDKKHIDGNTTINHNNENINNENISNSNIKINSIFDSVIFETVACHLKEKLYPNQMAAEIQSLVIRATRKFNNNKNKTVNSFEEESKEILTDNMSDKLMQNHSFENYDLSSSESNTPREQQEEDIPESKKSNDEDSVNVNSYDVTNDVIHNDKEQQQQQQKYYHIFTQKELNSLFQSVRNLEVTEWYQLKGSWVYILTKSNIL